MEIRTPNLPVDGIDALGVSCMASLLTSDS